MKTEQILNLDYRKEENKEIIQKVLRKIKPLSKCSDEQISLEKLEKIILIMSRKYNFRVNYISSDIFANEEYSVYRSEILYEKDISIASCYGISIYETICKTVIRMYSDIKVGKVAKR